MMKHVAALVAVAVAGWLVLLELAQRPTGSFCGLFQCAPPGVPDGLVLAAVVAALGAVGAMRPWRGRVVGLRPLGSAGLTVAPAFLPVALVALVSFMSDTPREDGRELLERIRHELRSADTFVLADLIPEGAWLQVEDANDGGQRWVVRDGEEILAEARVPRALGGCLDPESYSVDQRISRCD